MKKVRIIIIFLFILSVYIIPCSAVTTIKFATLAPEGSTWIKTMHAFDKDIRQSTNGEVKFKIYAGGVAGDDKDVLRKIRFNQYHAGGFTGVGLGEILPEVRVLDAPMLFNNYKEVDYIYSRFTPEFEKKFDEKGFVLLGWIQVGFVYFYSQKEIASMKDLSLRKVWSWEGDPVAATTIKAFGASPILLPVTDVLTSLETHLIDTVYNGPLACVSLQWFTKIKYICPIKITYATGAFLVSKKKFNHIKPEYQKLLKNKAHIYFKKLVEKSRRDDETSLVLMQKNGIKMVTLSKQSENEFKNAAMNARKAMIGKQYSGELLDKIENALLEYRKKNK